MESYNNNQPGRNPAEVVLESSAFASCRPLIFFIALAFAGCAPKKQLCTIVIKSPTETYQPVTININSKPQ
jgi:hypothetical protein